MICALLLAAAVAPAPVTVVVIADNGARADAARLQTIVEERLRNTRAPLTVTIRYYGAANAKALPPVQGRRRFSRPLFFGEFTIADRAGRILDSELIRYSAPWERLEALHRVADRIAWSVARLGGS